MKPYWQDDLHVVRNTGAGVVVMLSGTQLLLIVPVTSVGDVPDKVSLGEKERDD